jgi:hypothetical protein
MQVKLTLALLHRFAILSTNYKAFSGVCTHLQASFENEKRKK